VAENGQAYRMPGVKAEDVVFHPSTVPQGLKPRPSAMHNGVTKVPPFQSARIQVKAKRSEPKVVMTAMVERPATVGEAGSPPSAKDDSLGEMVVLVTWRTVRTTVPAADGSATQVTQSSQFSYAAVPTRNGWLFVQL